MQTSLTLVRFHGGKFMLLALVDNESCVVDNLCIQFKVLDN